MVFGVGLLNGVIYIYPRLTLVATKFEDKIGYLGLHKRYRQCSCIKQGFWWSCNCMVSIKFLHETLVAMATKIMKTT